MPLGAMSAVLATLAALAGRAGGMAADAKLPAERCQKYAKASGAHCIGAISYITGCAINTSHGKLDTTMVVAVVAVALLGMVGSVMGWRSAKALVAAFDMQAAKAKAK